MHPYFVRKKCVAKHKLKIKGRSLHNNWEIDEDVLANLPKNKIYFNNI